MKKKTYGLFNCVGLNYQWAAACKKWLMRLNADGCISQDFFFSRKLILFTGICFMQLLPCSAQNLVNYVQPLSGTANATTVAAVKHSESGSTETNANTIPAVGLPFGMTQFTPQTRTTEVKCQPPYFYKDSLLSGFRATHWLSGSCTQDYGSFTIVPVVSHLKTTVKAYSVPFSHSDETASPSYYKVTAGGITTEITATGRCGIFRVSLLEDDSLYILVTPNSDQAKGFVQVDTAKGEIWGYNPVHRIYQGWGQPAGFSGWFFIKIEQSISSSGSYAANQVYLSQQASGQKNSGIYAGFFLKKGMQLIIKTGTSFSSLAGAKKNLEQEAGNKSFYKILTAATATWQAALSKIRITTSVEKDKRIFYTAMYHAMQHPRLYNDVDGTYPAFAGNAALQQAAPGNYYDDFSMWDIYRAQLPLVALLDTSITSQFVQSLVSKGLQGGWLPIFPCWNSYTAAMIGDHVTAFIASAYARGIRNFNQPEAYRLMRKNAFTIANEKDYANGKGRRALPSYLQHGYIPLEDSVPVAFHKKEQVSRTLEYAYDDYALAMVAKGLGKTDDYKMLLNRAKNYKNVLDTNAGMVKGRYADGSWITPFNPDKREFYITEGTPRQYTFYVPQDIPGLAKMMGGRRQLENALNSLFNKNEYWHGNEPGHQVPFLYNYTASPWKTQNRTTQILTEEYSDGPGGLSGNDDAGQMSAWYVFAAMGFYPADPVSGNYLLTTPLFDSVSISLAGNKQFTIICHKSQPGAAYISRVKWNGNNYIKNYLSHATIAAGCKLEIWLRNKPTNWGATPQNQPPGLPTK